MSWLTNGTFRTRCPYARPITLCCCRAAGPIRRTGSIMPRNALRKRQRANGIGRSTMSGGFESNVTCRHGGESPAAWSSRWCPRAGKTLAFRVGANSVAWYLGLTRGRRDASPEIKQKVAELTAAVPTMLGKMQALANFVQTIFATSRSNWASVGNSLIPPPKYSPIATATAKTRSRC